MKFSHLIQINDPADPGIQPLSREQLWQGLMIRAQNPAHFLIGLDECAILNRDGATIDRQLRFGNLTVRDRVIFEAPVQVRYEIEAAHDTPGGSLIMRIEEPTSGMLFVRFEYELFVESNNANDYLNEFRKSAYVEADIDTIRMIRQLAASGLLEGSLLM